MLTEIINVLTKPRQTLTQAKKKASFEGAIKRVVFAATIGYLFLGLVATLLRPFLFPVFRQFAPEKYGQYTFLDMVAYPAFKSMDLVALLSNFILRTGVYLFLFIASAWVIVFVSKQVGGKANFKQLFYTYSHILIPAQVLYLLFILVPTLSAIAFSYNQTNLAAVFFFLGSIGFMITSLYSAYLNILATAVVQNFSLLKAFLVSLVGTLAYYTLEWFLKIIFNTVFPSLFF